TPELLFTENETNNERLFGVANRGQYVKDGINDYVVHQKRDAVNPGQYGTKASALYRLHIEAGESATLRLRLTNRDVSAPADADSSTWNSRRAKSVGAAAAPLLTASPFGVAFDQIFSKRIEEADEFYAKRMPKRLSADAQCVQRQAFAGMLWSKQFFYY